MTPNPPRRTSWRLPFGAAAGFVLANVAAHADITPEQAKEVQSVVSARIEALTIFGGDYGLAGGSFVSHSRLTSNTTADTQLQVSKLGGSGDIGDLRPLGDSGISWLPILQGNIGYLQANNHLETGLLTGDTNDFKTYGLEFGGGARFALTQRFSVATTVSGIYGRTGTAYTATSAFMRENFSQAVDLGLVNWAVDTWTVRPALDFQYLINWERTTITLSSDPTFFHTETFHTSNPNVRVNGDSWTFVNKADIDIPLGIQLFDHEVHTGGYFSRTDITGDLRQGVDLDHMYEIQGRLVLDFLNRLWKVKWLGISASYIWGPTVSGWTAGVYASFKF
jgi:Solitary outer membrane autotransporter beta-barrel domain